MKKVLFNNYSLTKNLALKNRIVMAPMTRAKSYDDHTPTPEMADYYAKRADAGLIITEGVIIAPNALGHKNGPGIFNQKHIDAWKKITHAVHEKNGRIFMQLWHVGRVSHPNLLNGNLPVGPSDAEMKGRVYRSNGLFYGKSRAASLEEIQGFIQSYVNGAKNAIAAGFDGVEIHGANGYLVDQFLHYDTNRRKDEYGGTPEKMARFALEIIKLIGEAIGYEKVGIRLSPGAYLNEIKGDLRDADVFEYLLSELNSLPIAYVHTGNFDDKVKFKELHNQAMTEFLRAHYKGNLIAAGSYDAEVAENAISKNEFNLVAIGRPFIANPDLISRIQEKSWIQPYDVKMLETLI
jgi:N-ethylmaleimide reductase